MSVGGGSYHRRRLSDLSLLWMIEQIQAWNLGVTGTFADLHPSVKQRWPKRPDYRPANLAQFRSELEQWQAFN